MAKAPLVYSPEQSTQLGAKLSQMAANPKGLQLRDLVQEHKAKIQAALDAGYSYDDIIAAFSDLGITIKPNTLKQYLRDNKGARPKRQPPKPAAKTISTVASAAANGSPTAVVSAAAPQPSSPADALLSPAGRAANTDERGFQRMRSDDEL